MRRLYITHCTAKKDNSLRGSDKKVPPDKLYTAKSLQRFVRACKDQDKEWAIFSDKHGILLPGDEIGWYEKSPSSVNGVEYSRLLDNLIKRSSGFEEIWFYHNPGRFHSLYVKLVCDAKKNGVSIHMFSHLREIE